MTYPEKLTRQETDGLNAMPIEAKTVITLHLTDRQIGELTEAISSIASTYSDFGRADKAYEWTLIQNILTGAIRPARRAHTFKPSEIHPDTCEVCGKLAAYALHSAGPKKADA